MGVNNQLPDDDGAYRKYAALLMSWLSVTDDFTHEDYLRCTRLRRVIVVRLARCGVLALADHLNG